MQRLGNVVMHVTPRVWLQASSAVNAMPTDDVDSTSSPDDASGVNPYVNHPDVDATNSDTSRETRHFTLSPMEAARGPTPFVPISTQMWRSGFTSIVSHLGGGKAATETITEDVTEGGEASEGTHPGQRPGTFHDSEDSDEIAASAPKWSRPGRSIGRMGAAAPGRRAAKTAPKSAPNPSADALQRAVEDIRHTATLASSVVAGAGGTGDVVAVPPQPAAQEMFRKLPLRKCSGSGLKVRKVRKHRFDAQSTVGQE